MSSRCPGLELRARDRGARDHVHPERAIQERVARPLRAAEDRHIAAEEATSLLNGAEVPFPI
eukprot:7596103-Alexandrium_andersonii.AAC.1